MFGTGGGLDGTLRHDFGEGAVVVDEASGSTLLATDRDFEGSFLAGVQAGLVVETAGVNLQSQVALQAEHEVFGFYLGDPGYIENPGLPCPDDLIRISYDGPNGTVQGENLYLLVPEGPGDYVFRVEQALEVCEASEVILFLADVRLPPAT